MMVYSRWARYYDALHAFKDYEAETRRLLALIERFHPTAKSLLDVACGTGRHLCLMQDRFEVEGLDLNPDLLAVASERCPDLRLHCARMEDFDLGRQFDVVTCMFTAISFVQTPERMHAAVASMRRHLAPGGLLVIEPWYTPDRYWTGTITSHYLDQPDLKIVWMYTSKLEDGCSVLDNRFLVGTPEGIESFEERHVFGLFTHDDFAAAFDAAGLQRVAHADPAWFRGLHVARAPALATGNMPGQIGADVEA
ncbi:MAG: class I SAM-dependent methyltransferase [Luteimonas sp.]